MDALGFLFTIKFTFQNSQMKAHSQSLHTQHAPPVLSPALYLAGQYYSTLLYIRLLASSCGYCSGELRLALLLSVMICADSFRVKAALVKLRLCVRLSQEIKANTAPASFQCGSPQPQDTSSIILFLHIRCASAHVGECFGSRGRWLCVWLSPFHALYHITH